MKNKTFKTGALVFGLALLGSTQTFAQSEEKGNQKTAETLLNAEIKRLKALIDHRIKIEKQYLSIIAAKNKIIVKLKTDVKDAGRPLCVGC